MFTVDNDDAIINLRSFVKIIEDDKLGTVGITPCGKKWPIKRTLGEIEDTVLNWQSDLVVAFGELTESLDKIAKAISKK